MIESGRASFTHHAGMNWAYLVVAVFSLCILALLARSISPRKATPLIQGAEAFVFRLPAL